MPDLAHAVVGAISSAGNLWNEADDRNALLDLPLHYLRASWVPNAYAEIEHPRSGPHQDWCGRWCVASSTGVGGFHCTPLDHCARSPDTANPLYAVAFHIASKL